MQIIYLLFLVFISCIFCQTFKTIYQTEEQIRAISNEDLSFAFITEKNVIFGNFTDDNDFKEISRIKLTHNLIGSSDLLLFKFFFNNSVIACNGKECCYCHSIAQKSNSDCITIAEFPIQSVAAQKSGNTLFLRIVHTNTDAAFYAYQYENSTFTFFGKSIDRTFSINEFSSIYSFSYGDHSYFLSRIKREDIAVKLLSQNIESFHSRINIDTVITQICNNDKSGKLISRMDLILSCQNMDYNMEAAIINYSTAALFLPFKNKFFIAFNESSICEFDMHNIKNIFTKTWKYCLTVNYSWKDCKYQTMAELSKNGCLKFSWIFPTSENVFPFCQNSGKLPFESSCIAAQAKPQDFGWLENVKPIYGKSYSMGANKKITDMILDKNDLIILENKKLTKVSLKTLSPNFTLNMPVESSKLFVPLLSAKNGVIYVDKISKQSVIFKDVICMKENCKEPLTLMSKYLIALLIFVTMLCFGLVLILSRKKVYQIFHDNKKKDSTRNFDVLERTGIPLKSKKIEKLRCLGEGNFGYVELANYTSAENQIKNFVIKRYKKSKYNEEDVLKEIHALSSCKHPNIVKFIDCKEISEQICIVTEYMKGGDLLRYLQDPKNAITLSTAFSYIFQILDAMIYLSRKRIVHRDLAARNCLLDETFKILKICDFGLARHGNINYEYIPKNQGLSVELPIKWSPPEAFKNNKFTVKGDVWSFAVLLWEIFVRGSKPYKDFDSSNMLELLQSGFRLRRPYHCPEELYTLMSLCWEEEPENRPNFVDIKEDIKIIFNRIKVFEPNKFNTVIPINDGYEIPFVLQPK